MPFSQPPRAHESRCRAAAGVSREPWPGTSHVVPPIMTESIGVEIIEEGPIVRSLIPIAPDSEFGGNRSILTSSLKLKALRVRHWLMTIQYRDDHTQCGAT